MTTYVEESIEEVVGNLAAIALSLKPLHDRFLKAIRAGGTGEVEWADYCDVTNRMIERQLELTDRMLEEGLATVRTHKVTAFLEFGHIGLNGDRPLAILTMNGKRVLG